MKREPGFTVLQWNVECMVGTFSRVWSNGVWLSILPCSWSARKGRILFRRPCSRLRMWSPETGSVAPPHVSPPRFLTAFLPLSAEASIYSYTANRHRVSPEFIRSRNCVTISFTAQSPPAQRASSSSAPLFPPTGGTGHVRYRAEGSEAAYKPLATGWIKMFSCVLCIALLEASLGLYTPTRIDHPQRVHR